MSKRTSEKARELAKIAEELASLEAEDEELTSVTPISIKKMSTGGKMILDGAGLNEEFASLGVTELYFDAGSGSFVGMAEAEMIIDLDAQPATPEDPYGMFRPSDEELAQINKFAFRKLAKNDVYSFTVKALDTKMTTKYIRHSVEALQEMAKGFPGKPEAQDHNLVSSNTHGTIYSADVTRDNRGDYLKMKFYMLDAPETKYYVDRFAAGINKNFSVSYLPNFDKVICDIDGKAFLDGCEHWPGMRDRATGKTSTFTVNGIERCRELSNVPLGACTAASLIKKTTLSDLAFSHLFSDEKASLEFTAAVETVKKLAEAGSLLSANETTAKISAASNTEETIVNKPETTPAAAPPAADNAPEPTALADFEAKLSLHVEEVKTLFAEAQTALAASVDPLAQQVEALKAATLNLTTVLSQRDEALQKQIVAVEKGLDLAIKLHNELAEKCNVGMAQSIEEMKQFIAALDGKEKKEKASGEQKQTPSPQLGSVPSDSPFAHAVDQLIQNGGKK
jgi:hypothetical protein